MTTTKDTLTISEVSFDELFALLKHTESSPLDRDQRGKLWGAIELLRRLGEEAAAKGATIREFR